MTGWERNDNYYFTATSLQGPWTRQGFVAPEGTLTWNSQVTFVLPVEGSLDTTFMFMGDRWSSPRQASAATYVWQPLNVRGDRLAMPTYRDAWRINMLTGNVRPGHTNDETITAADRRVRFAGAWQQKADAGQIAHRVTVDKGASVSVKFTGTQASLYSVARPDGGYARITLENSHGVELLSATVDMYSKYSTSNALFVTPLLPFGTYTMKVSTVGNGWYWVNKKGEGSGSAGHAISFERLTVRR